MLLTQENKRALKRIKGEQNLNYRELADLVGVHNNTIRRIIKNHDPEDVRPKTFSAISQFISKNY
ncbi:helix-turn-helix domain-containing protein [Lactococcus lactis]|uniref:helix-turn-helix domain-containing protein n=1 Tax=Lactococcus lactis TaxID=1358 RepID=UPI00071D76AE|nr:helix-turn-helix transcriptional regulator [Lactococcus lactis]